MPKKGSILTPSDISGTIKNMQAHVGQHVVVTSGRGSHEVSQSGTLTAVFKSHFTVSLANNKTVTSYNHIDVLTNSVKVAFGDPKETVSGVKKNKKT